MDAPPAGLTFQVKFPHFKTVSPEDKDNIIKNRKAANTNRSTTTWIRCLSEYLTEKNMPKVKDISDSDLSQMLTGFYTAIKKKKLNDNEDIGEYKNGSLKCMREALNRYFKEHRSIDIISNPAFIKTNEMFKGVTAMGKMEGHGKIDSYPAIKEADLKALSSYFENNMIAPPNAANLQEMVLFNLIYYGGHRGHENLHKMTPKTFGIFSDADGHKYIHQIVKEQDKTTMKMT